MTSTRTRRITAAAAVAGAALAVWATAAGGPGLTAAGHTAASHTAASHAAAAAAARSATAGLPDATVPKADQTASDRGIITRTGPGLTAPGQRTGATAAKPLAATSNVASLAAPGNNRSLGSYLRPSSAQRVQSTAVAFSPPHQAAMVNNGVPDSDDIGQSGGNATSTALVTNHGGAVQTSPHVYLVFWGTQWETSAGDPLGVANQLHYFLSGISGSKWAAPLTQYTSSYGSFTNPSGQYKGWLRDTTTVPASPTQSQLAAAAIRAAAVTGDKSYNAQYMIALPDGHIDAYTLSAKACAWHSYTYVNSSQWVTYSSLPYTPYLDSYYRSQYGVSCGGKMVNGTSGALDGVTINAGHEYAETVTDPAPNGWYDTSGLSGEVGDKCSWLNLADRTLSNGKAFAVQPLWSNYYRSNYGYGCYYSS